MGVNFEDDDDDLEPFDLPPNIEAPQLPSVRMLDFSGLLRSHGELHDYELGWIFPNLEALSVFYYNDMCLECDYQFTGRVNPLDMVDVPNRFTEDCVRQMVEPLRESMTRLRFAEVKVLYPSRITGRREWTFEELLAEDVD